MPNQDTDIESFEWLHPVVDGFRNFQQRQYKVAAEVFLIDRANLLTLTAPQLTALIGGLRTIGINWDGSKHGMFTDRPGVLSNDFFVNLFDMATVWTATNNEKTAFEGRDSAQRTLHERQTNQPKWIATRTDLVFGSDPQLRAIGEVYAAKDGHQRLVRDFVAAWDKVMMLDRFDVPNRGRVGKPPQG